MEELYMITLIEKWRNENATDEQLLKEIMFILNATKNGLSLFTTENTDESKQIKYCVPCGDEIETYGKVPGICYSEVTARDAILEMFNNYAIHLLSWLKNDQEEIDFCLKLKFTPVAVVTDENGVQENIYDAIFKFKKCNNKIGFCVKSVIPLLGYKNREEL